jgi:hypothetical protein
MARAAVDIQFKQPVKASSMSGLTPAGMQALHARGVSCDADVVAPGSPLMSNQRRLLGILKLVFNTATTRKLVQQHTMHWFAAVLRFVEVVSPALAVHCVAFFNLPPNVCHALLWVPRQPTHVKEALLLTSLKFPTQLFNTATTLKSLHHQTHA